MLQENELEALLGGGGTSPVTESPNRIDTLAPPPINNRDGYPPAVPSNYSAEPSMNVQDMQDSAKAMKARQDAAEAKLREEVDIDPITKATEDSWLVSAFNDMPEEGRQFRRDLIAKAREQKANWVNKQQNGELESVPQAQPDRFNYKNINKFQGFTADVSKDIKRKNLTYGLSTGDLIVERINNDDFVFFNKGDGKRGNLPLARITNDGNVTSINYEPDMGVGFASAYDPNYRSDFKNDDDFANYLHKVDRGEIKLGTGTAALESPTGFTRAGRNLANIANPEGSRHTIGDFYMPPEIVSDGHTNFNPWNIIPSLISGVTLATGASMAGAGVVPAAIIAGGAEMLNQGDAYMSGNQSGQETAVNIATDAAANVVGMKAGGKFIEGVKAGGLNVPISTGDVGKTTTAFKQLIKSFSASAGAAGTQDVVNQLATHPENEILNNGASKDFQYDPLRTTFSALAGGTLDATMNLGEAGGRHIGTKISKQFFKPKVTVDPETGKVRTNAEDIVKNIIDNTNKTYKLNPDTNTNEEVAPSPELIAQSILEMDNAIKAGANDIEIDGLTGEPVFVNNPNKSIVVDGAGAEPTGAPIPQLDGKIILDNAGSPVNPYTVEGSSYVMRDLIATDINAKNSNPANQKKFFTALLGGNIDGKPSPLLDAYVRGSIQKADMPVIVKDVLLHKEATNDSPIVVTDPTETFKAGIAEANLALAGGFKPTDTEIEALSDMKALKKAAGGDRINMADKVAIAKELTVYGDKVRNAYIDKVKTDPVYGADAEHIVNGTWTKAFSGLNRDNATSNFISQNIKTDPLVLNKINKKIEKLLVDTYPGLKTTIDAPKPKTYPKPLDYADENYNDITKSKVSYEDDYNGNLVNNIIAALYYGKKEEVALDELRRAGVGPRFARTLINNIKGAVAKSRPDENGIIRLNKDSFSFDRPAGMEEEWIKNEVVIPIISNYQNPALETIQSVKPIVGNNVDLGRAMLILAPTPEQLMAKNNLTLAEAKAWQKALYDDVSKQTGYTQGQIKTFAEKTIKDALVTGQVNVDKFLVTPTSFVATMDDVKSKFDLGTTTNKKTDAEAGAIKEDASGKTFYTANTQFVPVIADQKYGSLYNTVFDAVRFAESAEEAAISIGNLENQYRLKKGSLWRFGSQVYNRIDAANKKIATGKAEVPKDKPKDVIEVSTGMTPSQAFELNKAILANQTLDRFSAHTPIIKTVDNYPVNILTSAVDTKNGFPLDEIEIKTILNHNENNATIEDNAILWNYFRDKHDLEPENLRDIKGRVLLSVNTVSENLAKEGKRLEKFELSDYTLKQINKIIDVATKANKKNKATKNTAAVKATSELDVENNSTASAPVIADNIRTASAGIFVVAYADDEEENDDFWDMLRNGIGIVAIAGIMGGKKLAKTRIGKRLSELGKNLPASIKRSIRGADPIVVENRILTSPGFIKEVYDRGNRLVEQNPNITDQEFMDETNGFRSALLNNYKDLHNEFDQFVMGTLAQKAKKSNFTDYENIYLKGMWAREEANRMAQPTMDLLKLWSKNTTQPLQEAMIDAHQTFRSDYIAIKDMPEVTEKTKADKLQQLRGQYEAIKDDPSQRIIDGVTKNQKLIDIHLEYQKVANQPLFSAEQKNQILSELSNSMFDKYVMPEYEVRRSLANEPAISREAVLTNFKQFRQLNDGLTYITAEKLINQDLRMFPVREFLKESAPAGRIAYNDLKKMEAEALKNIEPMKLAIQDAKDELQGLKANAKNKSIDQTVNNENIKATKIHLKQLQADKEYTTLKQVIDIAELADDFITTSKASNYFDVHAARRYDEKQNDAGLVMKVPGTDKKFFKMYPNKKDAGKAMKATLAEWGAVKGADESYYVETPIYDVNGKVISTERNKVIMSNFSKQDNINSRTKSKTKLRDILENLVNTSSIIAKGATSDDIYIQKTSILKQLKERKKEFTDLADNGDEDAVSLITIVDQAIEVAEKVDPKRINNGLEIAEHFEELQKSIDGGGNSFKNAYQSKDYPGYRKNANGETYKPNDYVEGMGNTIVNSVTGAERGAMLSEIERQYGFMNMMGLTDNRYAEWLKKERDALRADQIQFGLAANVLNNFSAAKVSMDLGGRLNISMGNLFSNFFSNLAYEYNYGDASGKGLRLKNQFKNHLATAKDEIKSKFYAGKELLGDKVDHNTTFEQSATYIKFLNDIHNKTKDADAKFGNTKHYENIVDFKTELMNRFKLGGGLSESSIADLNLNTGRGKFGKAIYTVNKYAHIGNRYVDKFARMSVLKQAIDKGIDALGGESAIPFGDEKKMKEIMDDIIADAHISADIMFGRYNEMYKTDFEKAILRDPSFGQIAPTLLRFTSPMLVGANNSLRVVSQAYERAKIANKDNPTALKTAEAHFKNATQLITLGMVAMTLGGTHFSSMTNDFLSIVDALNTAEIDDEGMISPLVNTTYIERVQNWFKMTLMDAGFSPAGADKVIVAVKRGVLPGLTNLQISQQESILGAAAPYIWPFVKATAEIANQERITPKDLGEYAMNRVFGGVIKDMFVLAPDVIRGTRTEKDFSLLNEEYAQMEISDTMTPEEKANIEANKRNNDYYKYSILDFVGDLAFNKGALQAEARRDRGPKQNRMSTLGADNSTQLMAAFFNNANIKIESPEYYKLRENLNDQAEAAKYAPYIMDAFMDRLQQPAIEQGMSYASNLVDDILMENQEWLAAIANLNDRGFMGSAKGLEIEKIVTNAKSNVVDMILTEQATQALNDFLVTPQGQTFNNKYKLNRPTNRSTQDKATAFKIATGFEVELRPLGDYNNSKDYAVDNAKVAAIASLYRRWASVTKDTTDPSYGHLQTFCRYIWDPVNYPLPTKE